MITTALIYSAYYVLGLFVQIFPISDGFPSEVGSAFQYLGGYVGMLDPLVPISTLATCIGILITVELLIFSWKILAWVFSKVPIIGK